MGKPMYMLYFRSNFGSHLAGVFETLQETEKAVFSQPVARRKFYVVEKMACGRFFPGFSSADHIKEVRAYCENGWYENDLFCEYDPFLEGKSQAML